MGKYLRRRCRHVRTMSHAARGGWHVGPHTAVGWRPGVLAAGNSDANWPLKAPRIGGTLPASDADMVKLLTTGIWTNGQPLRFPMMPFRMSEADAKAVVAYLRSVRPRP